MPLAGQIAGALAKLRVPDFKHTPLDRPTSIRLVKLAPKTHDHLIRCTLVDVDLSTNPVFDALSYTWAIDGDLSGPRTDASKRTILCNNAAIDIFQNLYNALAQLQQFKWTSTPLWIDAICINQRDDVEKSAQVNMMGDIFRAASRVIVWLGRSSMATELALDKVEQFDVQDIIQASHSMSGTIAIGLMMSALTWVLSRGWFARVWTLQEAVLARETVYLMGGREVPFQQLLESGLGYLGDNNSLGSFTRVSMRASGLEFARTAHKLLLDDSVGVCTLEAALKEARNRRSADGRDKLFSVLALCRHHGLGDTVHLTADYQKPVQDVYCEAAAALLRSETTGIFLLSLVGQIRYGVNTDYAFHSSYLKSFKPVAGFVADLPSWVPDLNAPARPVPFRDMLSTVNFSAATTLSPGFVISNENTRLLELKAAVLDTITVTADCLPARLSAPIWRLLRLPIKLSESHLDTYAPTSESILDAFKSTLVAGASSNYQNIEFTRTDFVEWLARFAEDSYVISSREMLKLIIQPHEDGELDVAKEPDDRHYVSTWGHFSHQKHLKSLDRFKVHTMRKFLAAFDSPAYGFRKAIEQRARLLKRMNSLEIVEDSSIGSRLPFQDTFEDSYLDRRMFISEKGYLGTGPWTIVDGDVVMLVAGAYVPYVFRRSVRSEGAWELVGEAYCHGFMHGEGLDKYELDFDVMDVV